MADATEEAPIAAEPGEGAWLTPGVRGIGVPSFLADVGHEIPTALLPSLLTTTLGAPAATEGVKIPLGLWDGSTENATVATALLSDLVERPRPRAGDAVRDRRRQSAAQSCPGRVRRGAGATLHPTQGTQRP